MTMTNEEVIMHLKQNIKVIRGLMEYAIEEKEALEEAIENYKDSIKSIQDDIAELEAQNG